MGACFGSEAYEDMYGPIRDDAAPETPASDMFGSLLTMMTPTVFGSKFTDLACKVLTAPQRQFLSPWYRSWNSALADLPKRLPQAAT